MKKKKRILMDILMTIVLIVGICAALYPFVSDGLNQYVEQQVISYHQRKANEKNNEQIAAEKAKLAEKNREIAKKNNPGADPLANQPEKERAENRSYFEKHTIAVLKIPDINVSLPVYDQTNDVFLSRGATLLEGTSYPTGGTNTHAVISAHRGLPEAKLFTDLPKLKKGDQFFIEINQETLAYKVDDISVIEPTETEKLKIVEGQDYVTLMTCTPYMINSHRLLVRGHRVPYQKAMKKKIDAIDRDIKLRQTLLVIGCLLLAAILITFIYQRIKAAKIANRKYQLYFLLQDQAGQGLGGQIFQLYTRNGKRPLTRTGEYVYLTTDETGRLVEPALSGGRYTLKTEGLQLRIKVKKVNDRAFTILGGKQVQVVDTEEIPQVRVIKKTKENKFS
ncbi:class C sortase [Enterococcus viikkiensis]|uniref:class C sortase n=1 Tax=Enterococcus viikkiensis TaxID=930854 RepID=UPI003F931113